MSFLITSVHQYQEHLVAQSTVKILVPFPIDQSGNVTKSETGTIQARLVSCSHGLTGLCLPRARIEGVPSCPAKGAGFNVLFSEVMV